MACSKCNELKGRELPEELDAKALLGLERDQRVARMRPWVQKLRCDRRVVREYAALRELVEMARGGLT